MIHSSSDPLAGLDEAGFRTRILIPLLSAMGYRDVDHTHGPTELGKDIVAWGEGRDGSREYTAVVAKVGRVGGSASGDAGTVATQIRQAFGSPFRSKTGSETHHVHTVRVATTGTIKQAAKDAILAQIDEVQRRHVRFWDGDTVRSLLSQHLPERSIPDYTAAVHGALGSLEHFDVSTHITVAGVEYEVQARHADTAIAHITFAFPATPEAESALEAFNRHVEDGEPVTIPGAFIQAFVQHEELTRIFGDDTPTEISLRAFDGGRSSTVAVEVQASPVPLRYEGLTMRCVRSGARRSRFETDPGRPLTVALVLERLTDGQSTLQALLNLSLNGFSPVEAEHAIEVWDAIRSGAPYRVLALPEEHALSEGQAASPDSSPFLLRSYVSDLAAVARRLGWDIRIPEQVTPRDVLDAAELRSILETGVYQAPFSSYALTYTPIPGDPDPFFSALMSGDPFWFRTVTETAAYELLGRTVDLGAGESLLSIQIADGEADRVRSLLQDGALTVRLRFDAAASQTVTSIYPDFLPEDARRRYEALSDEEPSVLVQFVQTLANAGTVPRHPSPSSPTAPKVSSSRLP